MQIESIITSKGYISFFIRKGNMPIVLSSGTTEDKEKLLQLAKDRLKESNL